MFNTKYYIVFICIYYFVNAIKGFLSKTYMLQTEICSSFQDIK